MFLLGLLIGLCVGGCVGLLVFALCSMSASDDTAHKRQEWQQ